MSHWAKVPLAPPDKILGLTEAFKADPFPSKINLGVGAYRNDEGRAVVLESVRQAEAIIFNSSVDHEYAGIGGVQSFVDKSIEFAYGEQSAPLKSGRIAAVQSLSGTGACRVFGEFICKILGKGKKVYLPDPSWGNHIPIFRNAGLEPAKYRYFDPISKSIDLPGLLEDVQNAENGSVFLIHACAHNPTGCDPTKEQWNQLSTVMKAKKHVVYMDCAYQGFASGDPEEDAYAIRKFVEDGHHIILGQSFAKNFGVYGERVGALSVVTGSADEAARVKSQLKALVRPMYSNPPIYGARLVSEILSNPNLKQLWTTECSAMASRIKTMRKLLQQKLVEHGSTANWQHITDQIGMFCYTGLSPAQVVRLREEFHVYCTDDGRFSMAGVNSRNVAYLAAAVHACTTTTTTLDAGAAGAAGTAVGKAPGGDEGSMSPPSAPPSAPPS